MIETDISKILMLFQNWQGMLKMLLGTMRKKLDCVLIFRMDQKAVFLELDDSVLKQITITTGPRFEGNVLTSLPQKYRSSVTIETSKFKEKLAWIPCDNCENNNI